MYPQNCLYVWNSEWYDDTPCYEKQTFVCSLPTTMIIKVDTQLVFTSENISAPALQFKWVTPQTTKNSDNVIGGFKIKWKLKEANAPKGLVGKRDRFWKQKNEQQPSSRNGALLGLMHMVRESKRHKIDENVLCDSLLKHRWNAEILNDSGCL